MQINFMSINKGSILWIFMFIVLTTAPLFPNFGSFGFFSVEWSFFVAAALLMFLTVLYYLNSLRLCLVYDSFYLFMGFFVLLCLFSGADSPSKVKCILKTGQYIPYFFIAGFAINTINSERKLSKTFGSLLVLSGLFSIYIIIPAIFFQNRLSVNKLLLYAFALDTTKVFSFLLFTYSYCLQNILQSKKVVIVPLVFLVIMSGAVIVAGSRGGLGGMCLLILVTILTQNHIKLYNKIIMLFFIAVTGIAFLFMADYAAERYCKNLSGQTDITAFSRVYTAGIAITIMKDHMVNGVGMGNLSTATNTALSETTFIPPEIVNYWANRGVIFETTNMPLKLGAELGVIGFLFFFVFYWYLWKRINSSVRITTNPKLKIVIVSLRLSVFVSFVHNFIDTAFTNYYTWLYYGLVIAATRVAKLENEVWRNRST